MKRTCILFSILAATATSAQEPQTPPPAPLAAEQQPAATLPPPCDDTQLEATLADIKKAAETGDLEAIGQIYAQYAAAGHAPQAEAWMQRWLQAAEAQATNGNPQMMHNLGKLYLKGDIYLQPNPQKGVTWLSRAAEAGYADAAFALGTHFKQTSPNESKHFYQEAYRLFSEQAAATPNTPEQNKAQKNALRLLGEMELVGLGTAQNTQAAIAHLQQADTPEAHTTLFSIYAKGIGTDKNLPQALAYARKIADTAADRTKLQHAYKHAGQMAWLLADYYLNGKEGIPQDTATGNKYLDIADSLNIIEAIYYKALRHQKEGNAKEAYRQFYRAGTMGHPDARIQAAIMKMYGADGVEQDEAKAAAILTEMANRFTQGQSPYVGRAPYELALYYERKGEPELAEDWYRIASDRNVVEAMAKRGLSHINPWSSADWSPTLMYKWWKIGSDHGDATCTHYLRLFLWVGIPLVLIIVFGLPILTVHILNKRAQRREQATPEQE